VGRIIADPDRSLIFYHSCIAGISTGWQFQALIQASFDRIDQAKGSTDLSVIEAYGCHETAIR
jgi:hypothetical protein